MKIQSYSNLQSSKVSRRSTCIPSFKCSKHWFSFNIQFTIMSMAGLHALLILSWGGLDGWANDFKDLYRCCQRSGVTCWLGSGSITPATPEHQWVLTITTDIHYQLETVQSQTENPSLASAESQRLSKRFSVTTGHTTYSGVQNYRLARTRVIQLKGRCSKKISSDAQVEQGIICDFLSPGCTNVMQFCFVFFVFLKDL